MSKLDNNIENLGLTKQREIVLRVIHKSDEHLTANEIFEQSKQLLPGISFATVYNSLHYLKESGHIAEVNFGSGASRFDRKLSRHGHAICNKCGKLVDMELELPAEFVAMSVNYSKFNPESIELILRGLCPDCNK